MKEENNGNINLSYEEFNFLLEKEIGRGTDGKVIKYDKDLKIYRKGDYKKMMIPLICLDFMLKKKMVSLLEFVMERQL